MIRTKRVLAAFTFLAFLISIAACQQEDPADPALLLFGATVITATGEAPVEDAFIVVDGGVIRAIGTTARDTLPTASTAVDATNKYIVPGFIDVHAHVVQGPNTFVTRNGVSGIEKQHDDAITQHVLRLLLAYGVTTVRNATGQTELAVDLRDRVARGEVSGPSILTAGNMINTPPAVFLNYTDVVETEEQIRATVRAQIEAGVDYVKLYFGLPNNLVRAAIDEAHKKNRQTIGHLTTTSWTDAASANIDFVTHLPDSRQLLPAAVREHAELRLGWIEWLEQIDPDGPEIAAMIDAMVANDVAVDPTLVLLESLYWGDQNSKVAQPELSYVPAELVAGWRRGSFVPDDSLPRGRAVWSKALRLVGRLHESGVRVLVGSDTPNRWVIPGRSLHRELELLVDSGMTAREALTAVTRGNAEALGIGEKSGTIEVGKQADLVVLSDNPLEDISNTLTIDLVVKNGRVYERTALLAELLDE